MAQAQVNAAKSDKLNTPTYTPRSPSYNPKFSPPQSQDAFGLEMGMYDHRPKCMDREDFGILTTTMDGIITAMNVMSDQMNNHTTLVVNELKEQKEKNTKFMEKVDKKLLEMKKDLHKLVEDHKENTDGRTKQSQLIIKDERERFAIHDKKLREITERMDKWEIDQDSFRHNFTSQVKEDNQKLISTMEGILQNLQEEREKKEEIAAAAAPEPEKKRGACFICSDPGHYAPDCPNKQEKKTGTPYKGPYQKGNSGYYQKGKQNAGYQKGNQNAGKSPYFQHFQIKPKPGGGGLTIEERKQSSNCYQCGQQGHWASECPLKNIPEYNEEYLQDVDDLIKEELGSEFEEPEPTPPAPAPQTVPPAPKKRKLSLKKKDQQ